MPLAKLSKAAPAASKGKRKISEVEVETTLREKSNQKAVKKQRSQEEKDSGSTKQKEPTAKKSTTSAQKTHKSPMETIPHLTEEAVSEDEEVTVPPRSDGERKKNDGQEDEIRLEGFSSESDSSDEEFEVENAPPLDVSKLPPAKDDATIQRKLEKAKKKQSTEKGVIYLGRIPHGFYENQMRSYFSQFGDVSRLRLSRNKKTGRSKHYAFIEFASAEVAQIVSETMHNYLLLGHILQCRVIPKDQVHPELWVGANRKWRIVPCDRITRGKQNMPRTREQQGHVESRLIARQKKRQAKIADAGIDYDFQEIAYRRKA